MENDKGFSSLDPLGSEYGTLNQPSLDPINKLPFEGNTFKPKEINFPEYKSIVPSLEGLTSENQNIKRNLVGNPPNKPGANINGLNGKDKISLMNSMISNVISSNQSKDSYSKLNSYNAGSSGNAYYKRYAAYGAEKFSKIGFSPTIDNESNFNSQTSVYDDWKRMMANSFVPLLTRGFVSGPKSLIKMLQGDFTSGDLEDARAYEEAAGIGQSSKKGALAFISNVQMNFAYTAGIISEAIVEEVAGALLAPVTGGSSFFATTANAGRNIFRGIKVLSNLSDGAKAVKTTLNTLNNINDARTYWTKAKNIINSPVGKFLNPIGNTMDAFNSARKLDNISNLAVLSKTAGGFYDDVRGLNMAISEARLEAGMTENKVYDKLYNDSYLKNGVAPSDEEQYDITKQSKEAGLETFYTNAALIYGSNKITFANIVGPKGGLRNFIKSTTDDIMEVAAKQGEKNFGKIGKIIYDKTAKSFVLEKNNLKNLAKSWYKNPGFKTAAKTIGYFKANFSEGIQENLQEVIARANEKYYIESYQSPYLKSHLYTKSAINDTIINRDRDIFNTPGSTYLNELGKEFSSQGLETFASGFVMGAMAGPLNNAIPFLSTNWNKTFDKSAYNAWKVAKTTVAQDMVNNLNAISVKDFLSNKYYNAGAQDTLSLIKEEGSKKEGIDSELESYINQVDTMLQSNTSDLFVEKLEGLKTLSDEELIDTLKLEGEQVNNISKYRSKIDFSIKKLNNIQNAFNKVNELLPNPITLPNDEDLDKDEKTFMYHSWKLAQKNFVYFNESYKDNLQRINSIQQNYLRTPGLKNLSNTDVNYLFDPLRMGDGINALRKEITSLVALDSTANKQKINQLSNKLNALIDYQNNYEEFNKFYNRENYIGETKAKLVSEKLETTPESIQERMATEYGQEDDEAKQLKILSNLKKSHANYLNAISTNTDNVLFKEELDDSFRDLMDLYKLKQEAKAVGKYTNFISDPQGFYDTVLSNQIWMRSMYQSRSEYFTDMVNEQMNNSISNALLNKLAEKRIFMSSEDFIELKNNGVLPSEFYDDVSKLAINKGTSKYKNIIDSLITPYLEIINENAVNVPLEKNIDSIKNDLKSKMDSEINKLSKEEVITEEVVHNKPDGGFYSFKEFLELIPNGHFGRAGGEPIDSPMQVTDDKEIYNDDSTYYVIDVDTNGQENRIELTIPTIDGLNEFFKYKTVTTYKIEIKANEEEIQAIKDKYNERLKSEQEDYDSSRPEAMQKSIDEVLDLAKVHASAIKTKTNYFIDGIEYERMSNVIKSHYDTYTFKNKDVVQGIIDTTIGTNLTNETIDDFIEALYDKFGTTEGFTEQSYEDIETELKSIILFSVGAVINPEIQRRLNLLDYTNTDIKSLNKEDINKILTENIFKENFVFKTETDNTTMDDTRSTEEQNILATKSSLKRLDRLVSNDGRENWSEDVLTNALEILSIINRLETNTAILTKSEQQRIKRLKNRLKIEGYTVKNPKGKEYNDGMKVEVKIYIEDSSGTLRVNEEVITGVDKPAIFKDDEQVQRAEVIVTTGSNPNGISAKEYIATQSRTEVTDNTTREAKKADIEKRREELTNEIEELEKELIAVTDRFDKADITKKISSLKEELSSNPIDKNEFVEEIREKIVPIKLNGVTQTIFTTVEGVDRPQIFLNVNGKIIGFYKSSNGTDGKVKGNWYPFYGAAGGWIVKDGGGKDWKYNSSATEVMQEEIKIAAELLNKHYGEGKSIPKEPTLNFKSQKDYNEQIGSPLSKLSQKIVIKIGDTKGGIEEYNDVKKEIAERGFQPQTEVTDNITTTDAKKEIERIANITDSEKRKAAEIEYVMSNLFAGVGEASANKIKEYANRIINGQSRDKVIEGLPASFVKGIDALLAVESLLSNQSQTESGTTISESETTITGKNSIQKNIDELNLQILNVKDNPQQVKVLENKLSILINELNDSKNNVLNKKDLDNFVINTVSENIYEINRNGGTYLDSIIKQFLDLNQSEPVLDESKMTKEAFESLFGENGFIRNIKNKVQSGEFWIYPNDLIVASDNLIDDKGNKLKPVAGEIDFIIVDKEGNKFIMDLKTNRDFNNYTLPGNTKSKIINNTLQQIGYANLIENTNGQKYNISILPVMVRYDDGKIDIAIRPNVLLDSNVDTIGGENPFAVILDENIKVADKADSEKFSTAKEIMNQIIPVSKPKTKPSQQTKVSEKDVTNFTKEELDLINFWENLINEEGVSNARQVFAFTMQGALVLDDESDLYFANNKPTLLHDYIVKMLEESTFEKFNVTELPIIGGIYYFSSDNNSTFEVEVLSIDGTKVKYVNLDTKITSDDPIAYFNSNFMSKNNIDNPSIKPETTFTQEESENANENRNYIDDFLESQSVKDIETSIENITTQEALNNLLNNLNC